MGVQLNSFQNTINNVMHSFNQRRNQQQNFNQGNQQQGANQPNPPNFNSISTQINDPRSRTILEICSLAEQLSVPVNALNFVALNLNQLDQINSFIKQEIQRIESRLWDYMPNKKAKT